MPSFQINDAEWSALADEPADVFKLYCAIRRFMDYRTGVSGQKRRLSEQMFREELYIAPTRGRHESGSPTRQKVRSLVDRLITLGAITPVGPLVYQLPNADWDSPSKTSATDEQPDQQPDQQPEETPENLNESGIFVESEQGSTTGSESSEPLISNLPPISVNPIKLLERGSYFPMPLDGWAPDPKTFKAICFKNKIPVSAATTELLDAFCSYWYVRPEKEQSQAQWEYQLVAYLNSQIQYAKASGSTANGHARPENPAKNHQGPGASSGQRNTRQGPLSVPDRVRAAIAERDGEDAATAARQALDQDERDVRPPLDVEFRRIS
ncbi:DnaT-like ssDNA-binding domain-containing protein [Pseudomonas lundensis]|uniref:DnaT-like ssDNA-binding domain-containing protein n=1 Tax=Pseudomonas lundensis TaxID=86185 RepID=UPI00148245A1|nr:DnaT-like ssDNA-binding domain-containing protein [Pseudomonas lundensis]